LSRIALPAAFLLFAVFPAQAENWWLVIGDSDSAAQRMAQYASFRGYPQGFLIQTSDCGQPTNLYAWVMEVQRSAEFGQRALSRLSENWPKAYLLHCDVQRHSLLSWGLSPVDASIADVPDRAVTWTDRDRVSTSHPLADGRTAIVVRSFDRKRWPSDEGKRVRVILGPAFGDLVNLSEDCPEVGGFAVQRGFIAFHCGSPGPRSFHEVRLFDRHGRSIFRFERCRDPSWAGDRILSCQEEVLSAEGELTLRTKRIALTPGIVAKPEIERLWLAVGLADLPPQEIAIRAKSLSEDFPAGLAVQMSDCGGRDDRLVWVAEASPVKEVAEAALARLRMITNDAHLEPCDNSPGTLLHHRVSAVDPSIAEIAEPEYEYWDDADKVSSAHPLSDGLTIIRVRYYEPGVYSELPGRLERVLLGLSDGSRLVLENSCFDGGGFVNRKGLVAFHCMDQSIAHLPFHGVRVFDQSGKRVAHIPSCRDPVFSRDDLIACQSISYTEDRELTLQTKSARF
jgi:hypothetical protein